MGNLANVASWAWSAGTTVGPGEPLSGGLRHVDGLGAWQAYRAVPVPNGVFGWRVMVANQDNPPGCANFDVPLPILPSYASATIGEAFDLVAAGDVAVANAFRGIFVSTDFGRTTACEDITWTALPQPDVSVVGSRLGSNSLALHPSRNVVYVARSGGVAIWDIDRPDLGWDLVPGPEEPTTCGDGRAKMTVTSVLVEQREAGPERIIIGTENRGAFETINHGRSWRRWGLNLDPPGAILFLRATAGARPTRWIGTTRGLYRSRPGRPGVLGRPELGGGWRLVLPRVSDRLRIPFAVADIEADPRCPTRLYAAVGFGGRRMQHGLGVFFSADDGETWEAIGTGTELSQVPVADVAVAPDDSRFVYAATYGRGVWRFFWDTPLPECQP